jgi:hypothetical protein
MVGIYTAPITHQHQYGGITFAVPKTSGKKMGMSEEIDQMHTSIKHSICGILCRSCLSQSRGKCYFVFRKYPGCYLSKI